MLQRTESRLTEDHAQVARERTMLQDSLRQLQNEHNSNEKSISQSRRRMEDHLARVDRQLFVLMVHLPDHVD